MDIERMYKFIVMEHVNDPLNKDLNLNSSNSLRVLNDSCGDSLFLDVSFKDNKVENVKWNGTGCSLSMSVSSIMSEWIKNDTLEELKYKMEQYQKLVLNEPTDNDVEFLELEVMSNQLPARYKCATLFLQGVEAIIKNKEEK